METTEWYTAMGEAMKHRERALTQIASWQRKLEAAEAAIAELTQNNTTTSTDTDQE